jgi:thioredoxin reductase
LAAAIELKRLGVRDIVVVDREPEAGGIPRLCHHTGFGLRDVRRVLPGPRYAELYRQRAQEAGVQLRTSTTITGWQSATQLMFTSPHGLGQIEAQAVLLATGCRERPRAARLIPGHRPAGVFTTGSLQRFVYEQRQPVGKRAVIVGAELVSLSALLTLRHAHIATALMTTEASAHQIYFPYLPMKWLITDVLTRTPIATNARVTNILGRARVEGVEVTHTDTGQVETVECDTVVFTGDWIPEHELARLGGLTMDSGTRGPQVDAAFRTSQPGVFAAGNLLRGAETADWSALEGQRDAAAIQSFLQTEQWSETLLSIQALPPLAWVYPNTLTPDIPFNELRFRSREFRNDVRVGVRQGQRLLHQQFFRQLIVNETQTLRGQWHASIDWHGEPITLMVE